MERKTEDGMCEIDFVDPNRVAAAQAQIPPEEQLRAIAQAVKVLAHPSRLKVLLALEKTELCVCDLSQILGQSMSGTSQQLKELRQAGAITFRTEGKLVYYRLADLFWRHLIGTVAGHLGFESMVPQTEADAQGVKQ